MGERSIFQSVDAFLHGVRARTITHGSFASCDSNSDASETSKILESVSAAAMEAWRPPDSSRDKNASDKLLRQPVLRSVQPRLSRNSRSRAPKELNCD